MFQRRTRARIELGVSVVMLLISSRLRKYMEKHDEPVRLSPSSAIAGALSQGVRLWMRDHDIAGIRTRRSRRVLFGLVWTSWQQAVVRRSSSDSRAVTSYSVYVGGTVATIAYRLWYGLLHPLPDADD